MNYYLIVLGGKHVTLHFVRINNNIHLLLDFATYFQG